MPDPLTSATEAKNRPDYQGAAHAAQETALKIVRDVYSGTLRLREEGAQYLPKFPKETWGGYGDRKKTAVLFNAFKRTVKGLVGMVLRKDPQPQDDIPDEIIPHLENVDLTGRALPVFVRDVFEDAMIDGHGFIFVDWSLPRPARHLAEERELGARPYWIDIRKDQLLSFRTQRIGGRPVLTQIAWRETAIEPDGKFGEKKVERIRVYRLGQHALEEGGEKARRVQWEVWRRTKSGGEEAWVLDPNMGGVMSIDEIPLVPVYTNRTGFLFSEPPLLDLALENIGHFQLRSDRMTTLHIAGVPIPVFSGLEQDGDLTIGSDHGVRLPAGGDAKYLEPQGNSLEETRLELKDVERRMALLGLSMLMSESRAAETATSKRIDKAESDSQLAAAARGLEDALEEALRLHAKWMSLEQGGSIAVNRDFENLEMTPQMAQTLSNLVAHQQLSLETLWEIMIRGELLPESFDPEIELDRMGSLDSLDRLIQRGEPADAA